MKISVGTAVVIIVVVLIIVVAVGWKMFLSKGGGKSLTEDEVQQTEADLEAQYEQGGAMQKLEPGSGSAGGSGDPSIPYGE